MSINLSRETVATNCLLLDPNNPRFFDLEDWEEIPTNLFHLESVQNTAYQRLENTQTGQIDELKESIKTNGYIPAEVIIVKPYNHDNTKYVVIEGNRRLTAIRSITLNSLDPDNDPLIQSLLQLEVLIFNPTGDLKQDSITEMILQGIRHIGGPKEWGAYQKANLVVKLTSVRLIAE